MAEETIPYLTVKDYSKWVGMSIPSIYVWINSGKIPPENIKSVLNNILIKKIKV